MLLKIKTLLIFPLVLLAQSSFATESHYADKFSPARFHEHIDRIKQAHEEFNKNLVKEAYTSVYGDAVAENVDKYWAEDLIIHNVYSSNGIEELRDFAIDNRAPNMKFEVGSVFAQGDYVGVHSRATGLAPEPIIFFDIVRVIDGKIVEHWDVDQVETGAQDSVNGNAMFPIESPLNPSSLEWENKKLIITAMTEIFVKGNLFAIDQYFKEDYIQHNPMEGNGKDAVKAFVSNLDLNVFTQEIGLILTYGDFVITHSRYTGINENPFVAIDIYRIEDGMIAEHWDVIKSEVKANETVSGNSMFPIY